MSKQDRRERAAAAKPAAPAMSRLKEYFWANVIFWAFITVLSLVVWWSCSDPLDDPAVKAVLAETFKFMLLLFGFGFSLVTVFDWAYDFFAAKAEEPGAPGGNPAPPVPR